MQAMQLSSARAVVASRAPLRQQASRPASAPLRRGMTVVRASGDRESAQAAMEAEQLTTTALLVAAGLLAPLLLDADSAQAAVPALIKGRTFSLIHPGASQQPASGGGRLGTHLPVCQQGQRSAAAGACRAPSRTAVALALLGGELRPSASTTLPHITSHHSSGACPAAINFFLFGSSVYAGYLGLQWRRTR